MSLWTELGFRDNPYSTTPIRPTSTGARLLVGREAPLRRLERGITSADTLPTVEGDNGVGKTSLAAIAGYNLLRAFDGKETTQLFLSLPAFPATSERQSCRVHATRLLRDSPRVHRTP